MKNAAECSGPCHVHSSMNRVDTLRYGWVVDYPMSWINGTVHALAHVYLTSLRLPVGGLDYSKSSSALE
jgi:hypothetical protein